MKLKLLILFLFFNIGLFSENETPVSYDFKYSKEIIITPWVLIPNDDNKYLDLNNIESHTYLDNPSEAWQFVSPELSSYQGTAWYIHEFVMDNVSEKMLAIRLPFSFGSIQLYFNGKLLYESNNFNLKTKSFSSKPILLEFSPDILSQDSNFIALRIKSYSGWGGLNNAIHIGYYDDLLKDWMSFLIFNIAISFVCLFLAIYFTIHYIFRKKESYNLIFAGFCLSVALFVMGYHGLWLYIFDYNWAYWLLTFIGGINMYLLPILFIHSFYNIKTKLFAKIFSGFYLFLTLFVIVEFIFTGQLFIFNKYLYLGFNLSYIVLVIYLIVISIKAVKLKLDYSRLMLLSIILLSVTFVYSMLCFAAILQKTPIIGEGFFLMVLVYSVILARRFSDTHQELDIANKINTELNKTLETTVNIRTDELRDKNRVVMDSIEYASRIQNSMLPTDNTLEKYFSDYFTIWKPKNIVGGDSYWFYSYDKGFLVAVIDCTGHGVPGAILSTTANSVMDRIASHINRDNPSIILHELNKILKRILSQDNPFDVADDGLDIGLCHYSFKEKVLTFSGSKIRLHYAEGAGEVHEIKGDRQGIGYKRSKIDYNYSNHKINVTPNTKFYMTTDGFLDQNGGDNEFGFGWSRYLKVLKETYNLKMIDQRAKLLSSVKIFQGVADQRDDIALIGFKVLTEPGDKKND